MNELKERLEELMKEHGLRTQQQLADFAGVTKGLVGQWFSGQTKLGAKPLMEFEKKTNFSTIWLAYGTGEKYKKNERNTQENQDIITIGQIDITASCGKGVANLYDYPEIVRSIDFKIEQVKHLFSKLQAEHTKLISTDGDSMHPKIPKGATVFIDVSKNYFCGDGIYLFFYRGDLYLKRLQKTPEGLFAISDNEKYKPFYIQEEYIHEFNIVARYVGILNVAID